MAKPVSVPPAFRAWFQARGWKPAAFQREAWAAGAAGESGLIHAPTGQGKTLAAWLGPAWRSAGEEGLRVLWITPLRALAADTVRSLQEALDGLGIQRRVEARTGDTAASARARQKQRPPLALVTTPESLSLLLTDAERLPQLAGLRAVIVDEWHELLGSKRGVQTELCLARLRALNPAVQTWGLSATIGNLDEAMRVLLGAGRGRLIHGRDRKRIEVQTLLPREMESFPWSGHVGARLVPEVVRRLREAPTSLLFTNTRSQTEIWFQELLDAAPDLRDGLAMHHGSIDRADREAVEQRLRTGAVRAVVCTSSLDLGVDFSPVAQVLQVGSPKGVARLMQRAGRSGHQPGAVSRVVGVPTHALELVEFAAARESLRARRIEARRPLLKPLDLLAQHLVTVALGGGFRAEAMLAEVRGTHAFAGLTDREWRWVLDFITTGGALHAYPQYRKVSVDADGVHRLTDARLARLHRMSLGTIVADASVSLRLKNGRRLGSVEEWFLAGIRPGRCFIFGGRCWQLVRVQGLSATVQVPDRAQARGEIPSWQGGKSPLSTELAAAVGEKLRRFRAGLRDPDPEMRRVRPVLEVQARWSLVPEPAELLIETTRTREGQHVFIYPFAGRVVNAAIGTLIGCRLGRRTPLTLQITPNDYGFELFTPQPLDLDEADWRELLAPEALLEDVLASINLAELGRHQFRETARIAGLILSGQPGAAPGLRQLQASSSLLYDVFAKYDPDNLLLRQAQREVLERQMEFTRLQEVLAELRQRRWILKACARLTPLAFPLWAGRISSHIGSEDPAVRLARMLAELEAAAK